MINTAEHIIKSCGFSEEMETYLLSCEIPETLLIDIILGAPIPFKPGDIVILDCLPFRPVKHAVLLEVDNSDCCGVQMLYCRKNEINGKIIWETGALKHGDGWGCQHAMLSSLYRLSTFDGELPKEERLMKVVQQYIYKNEENGRNLWNFINDVNPDETELYEFMRSEE